MNGMFRRSLPPGSSRKRLVENFFSLSLLQAGNYLLPLLTFPYLVRVLGPEKWGLITFAQVFAQYFGMFTDYGFRLSATREISVSREDKTRMSAVFSSVMCIKILLLLVSLAVVTICILSFDKFRREPLVYAFSMGIVAGRVLMPIWFFQGIERMRFITIMNFLARLVFAGLVFTVIRETGDYVYVPLLNSIGFIASGLLGVWIAVRKFGIALRAPRVSEIKHQLSSGWHMFLSSASTFVYKSVDIILLGLFTSDLILGSYAIAKRLIDIANNFNTTVTQTIYPQMALRIRDSLSGTMHFLGKVGKIVFAVNLLFGLVFVIFAEFIIRLITGGTVAISIQSLRFMSAVPLIIAIIVPAAQFLLGANEDRAYFRGVGLGAVAAVALNAVLIPMLSFWGACASVVIVESLVTISIYSSFRRSLARLRSGIAVEETAREEPGYEH